MNKKSENILLKEIEKIEESFLIEKENKNLDGMIDLKNSYKKILDKFERVDRKISNYLNEKQQVRHQIGLIEEYYNEIECLIPFFKKHNLHSTSIEGVKRILLDNDTFSKETVYVVLGQSEKNITEFMDLLFENFEVKKEVIMECSNCNRKFPKETFFIPFNVEISEKIKNEKRKKFEHECFQCSLTYKEQKEKCPKWIHGFCNPDVNCEYNIYKDNQSMGKDLLLKESKELKLVFRKQKT